MRLGKHVGEDPQTLRTNEIIGYIVIDAGMGFNYFDKEVVRDATRPE